MDNNLIFAESQKISESIRSGRALIGSINDKNEPNFMTIGWGMIGNIWYKPIFITYIRPSRYTFKNINHNPYFTLNIFLNNKHQDILDHCGSISFYDDNKIKKFNINHQYNENNIPFHSDADIVLDCKVIYKQNLDKNEVKQNIKNKYYGNNDYHTSFYGEILNYRDQNIS